MTRNDKQIHLRVTETEYNELLRQTDFLGLKTYSDLIRMYINNAVCVHVSFDGMFETATQISRIGNNINQIAKMANETRSVSPGQIDQMLSALNQIEKFFDDFSNDKIEITKYIARRAKGSGEDGDHEDHQSQGE